MKCLVTGATGFIGTRLVEQLLARGFQVNALVRSPNKLEASFSDKITVFQGDLLADDVINQAICNCEVVFHLAAFAGIWAKDKMLPYRVNVTGTKNILDAAMRNKINKVVFTSTAGTLAPSDKTQPVDENTPPPDSYHTDYARSKLLAEKLCEEYSKKGLNTVVVKPTRVFGPGPLNKSNSVTLLIKKYLAGNWRFLPGNGESYGNYVYVDDVVNGHILALDYGIPGGNYILGGANTSFNEFFKQLSTVSGKNYKMFHVPFPILTAFSEIELLLAEQFGKQPLITPSWVNRYMQNRLVSSRKAIVELGYEITPLKQAFTKTIQWLNH